MMKSISYWSMPGGLSGAYPICQALADAKCAGFEGLELAVAQSGVLTVQSDPIRIRQDIAAADVQVQTLASGMSWAVNPTSDDASVRAHSIALHQQALKLAAGLGCQAMLYVPGVSRSPICADIVPYELAVSRAREAILQLLEVAEQVDVDLCIENVWNGLFYSPLELRDFIDSFGSERLGVYLDVGNLMGLHQYPPHWIEILAGRIKRVHIKDYRENFDWTGGYSFCDLGAGEVPWAETMAALRSVNYTATVTAEMLPWDAGLLARTSAAMDQLLNLGGADE